MGKGREGERESREGSEGRHRAKGRGEKMGRWR